MTDAELGGSRRAKVAYSLGEIALVPSRRTRDPDDVSTKWRIDAFNFEFPVMAAPVDSVMSPATAVAFAQLGGCPVLDLEGIWVRYSDPEAVYREIFQLSPERAIPRLQEIYQAPIDPELLAARISEVKSAGVIACGAFSPARVGDFYKTALDAGLEMLVIRGTTVSAEHVGASREPINLKEFIYQLDIPVVVGGCASYQAALHLMRTGAAGILVGFGGGSAHRTEDVLGVRVPMATALAEVATARRDYLDESGGRYVHVIADGGISGSGDFAKALAVGADAVMLGAPLARASEAPGQGKHWGSEVAHASLPRGAVVDIGTVGDLTEIMVGPSRRSDGSMNLVGALRRSMATCGYADIKDFQRVEVAVLGGR
jgi:IMP dehydrogenase